MVHKVSPCCKDDEVPQDINAFFGHPLNSSFQNDDGATALLHEYKSLPAIDKTCKENFEDNECIESQRALSEDHYIFSIKSSSSDDSHLLVPEEVNDSSQNKDEFNKAFDEDLVNENAPGSPCADDRVGDDAGMDELISQFINGGADPGEFLMQLSEETVTLNDCNKNDSETSAEHSPEPIESKCTQNDSDDSVEPMVDSSALAQSSPKMDPPSPLICTENARDEPVTAVTNSMSTNEATTPKQIHVHQSFQMHQNIVANRNPMPSQAQPDRLQQVAANQMMVNPGDPRMPYHKMSPQFMSTMLVHTSSGQIPVRPFFVNDQIGFTFMQRPEGLVQQQSHMMHWNNPPFYPYNMGCRPVAPELMTHQMYNPYPDYHTMVPAVPMRCPVQPPSVQIPMTHNSLPPQYGYVSNSDTIANCPQPKLEPKTVDEILRSSDSDAARASQRPTEDLYADITSQLPMCVKPEDTLQKACALSNIQQISVTSNHIQAPISASHLKSPDSGFGELARASSESEINASSPCSSNTEAQGLKRRRGSMCAHSKTCATKHANGGPSPINYIKRLDDDTGYQIRLEAATSCGAKVEDDRMTYLNKGQHYTLTMTNTTPAQRLKSRFVKAVVTLRFRDENTREGVSKYWQFWHSRQDVEDARGIDLAIEASEGIIDNTLCYTGVNSLTFAWDPHEPVKAQIAVHCLSTDFSSQKGVKGLPLHLQVDTYDDIYATTKSPVHRAYAQIKIFCEKGAERKARDEEKKKEKATKPSDHPGLKQADQFHAIVEHTNFYSMADLKSDVFVYQSPTINTDMFNDLPFNEFVAVGDATISDDIMPSLSEGDYLLSPPNEKRMRLNEHSDCVLVYVRESDELAYTALVLKNQTTRCLYSAVKEKYPHIRDIKMVYKKIPKGLVKLDDSLVRHLVHESTYLISFKKYPGHDYDITLTEIDDLSY